MDLCSKYNDKWFAAKKIYEKLLPPSLVTSTSDQVNKLMEEITTLLQSTKHPNIEKYEVVLKQAPNLLLLSELLPECLDKFITRLKEKMRVYLQVNICHDMALGLQYLHSAGIIHKNLHSGNVLITHELHAKIADYICPQVLTVDNTTNTATNRVYLAPEVKGNELHSFSSDVYSLGTLFFQTVTTHLPAEVLPDKNQITKDSDMVPSHRLLHMVTRQCLNSNELTRPSVNEVCIKVAEAKETPQYVLSADMYGRKVGFHLFKVFVVDYKLIHLHTY